METKRKKINKNNRKNKKTKQGIVKHKKGSLLKIAGKAKMEKEKNRNESERRDSRKTNQGRHRKQEKACLGRTHLTARVPSPRCEKGRGGGRFRP